MSKSGSLVKYLQERNNTLGLSTPRPQSGSHKVTRWLSQTLFGQIDRYGFTTWPPNDAQIAKLLLLSATVAGVLG